MVEQISEQVSPNVVELPRRRMNGRYIVLFTMLGCLLILLFTTLSPQNYKLWRNLGVPSLSPTFADTRTLTVALESDLAGDKIWEPNVRDPWERAFNYPRAWLLLKPLGINQSHTNIIGLSLALIFFACLWPLARKLSFKEGLYFALLIFSPVTMFAVERGNIDLLMFAFLMAALLLFDLKNRYRLAGAAALIMVAAIAKLFPFFGIALFWSLPRKKWLLVTAICSALFGGYLLLTAGDLALISNATPRPTYLGYGSDVIFAMVLGNSTLTTMLSKLAFLLLLGGVWLRLRKSPVALDDAPEDSFELKCFRVGACVYLGTFLLGSNWDYRLVFLLLTIPQCLRWYRPPTLMRAPALLSLICIPLAFHWYFYSNEDVLRLILVKQAINWTLVGGLFYLLLRSAPQWLKELVMLRGQPRALTVDLKAPVPSPSLLMKKEV